MIGQRTKKSCPVVNKEIILWCLHMTSNIIKLESNKNTYTKSALDAWLIFVNNSVVP